MAITDNSLAPANAVDGENVVLKTGASVLPRKLLVIGTFDPALTAVVPDQPIRVLNADWAGANFGFGFMLHRLLKQAFKSAPGVEIYAIPQDETVGAAASDGAILIDTAPAKNGTQTFYIAGDAVPVSLLKTDTAANVATKVIAAINANDDLPVTAAVDGVTAAKVIITAKSKCEYYGDAITITSNENGESDLGSIAYTITPMADGGGTPDITDALESLGTGSGQNDMNITDLVHGYGPVTAVLDKISEYNGIADEKAGNYDDLVHKPFRSLCGDTVAGSAGLAALIAFGNGRKEEDRTNGIIPVPGSPNHPAEIAALAMGYMATVNNKQAELSYQGIILSGIIAGAKADDWTQDYTTGRDAAAQAGISTTKVESGSVKMQNALTFYHPAAVPATSNAYRNMRNISLIQNIFNATASAFGTPAWKQFSIVDQLAFVTNPDSKKTAKSTSSVIDTWIELIDAFIGRAWIANRTIPIESLKVPGAVSVRTAGNGFKSMPKFIFSGDGDIIQSNIQYDTSFALLQ